MNIQNYIDRKRIAGAREHEGNSTDWAGWTREQFLAAIAGELLDALAYVEQSLTTAKWPGCCIEENMISANVQTALGILPIEALEAACQEAEQEANKGIVNCPYCKAEQSLWDNLPDNSYIPDDVNVICCQECCEEFDVVIHSQFDFEVKQEAENG